MKRLIIVTAVLALLAAAVFGGQALAAKPTCSSLAIETFRGHFYASDYLDGFDRRFLEVPYPEVRHVSLTVTGAYFGENDDLIVLMMDDVGLSNIIDAKTRWDNPSYHFETYEFDTHFWYIDIDTPAFSNAIYSYSVTVTFPR